MLLAGYAELLGRGGYQSAAPLGESLTKFGVTPESGYDEDVRVLTKCRSDPGHRKQHDDGESAARDHTSPLFLR